jgi:hypothetical protein
MNLSKDTYFSLIICVIETCMHTTYSIRIHVPCQHRIYNRLKCLKIVIFGVVTSVAMKLNIFWDGSNRSKRITYKKAVIFSSTLCTNAMDKISSHRV